MREGGRGRKEWKPHAQRIGVGEAYKKWGPTKWIVWGGLGHAPRKF